MELKQLPNATATLVLGICSILSGCLFIGLICGIVGLTISAKSKQLYLQNPTEYEGYGMLNAGRIMSVIGIVLGSLSIVYYLIAALFIGAIGFAAFPWMFYL